MRLHYLLLHYRIYEFGARVFSLCTIFYISVESDCLDGYTTRYIASQLIAVLKHIHLDEPSLCLREKDLFFNSSSSNFSALRPVAYIIHE
jgi:hypothetical protein